MASQTNVTFAPARLFLVAFVFWFNTAPATAQHWPSFRGPNGGGLGTGDPPIKWDVAKGDSIKWKTRIPGLAHSSPIVWGDRVFITTAIPMAGPTAGDAELSTGWLGGSGDSAKEDGEWEWRVLCLDRTTGKVLWDQSAHMGIPKFKRHPKSSHANCTPVTDGKHVVALFASEGVFCYDLQGKLLWKKDLGPLNAAPAGAPDLQWGHASSPIIHDGTLIVQCDVQGASFWAALDLKDGRERFRIERGDDPTWCTPTVHQGKERTQVICNGFKKMASYNLSDGKELWTLHGGGDVPVPRPIVSEDLIFLTNGHGRKPVYAIRADAGGELTPSDDTKPTGLAWWNKTRGSYMPTPILVDDVLFVADDNGVLTALDAVTGKEHFRERIPGGGKSTYSASPVAASGRLYITSEDGQIDVVRAGKKYEHLASNQMTEICMATPAVSDGLLLVRGKNHLYCIGK